MGERKGEELKGRAKEAAGDLTGNEQLEREGKADQTSAKTKRQTDKAVDKVKDAFGGDRKR